MAFDRLDGDHIGRRRRARLRMVARSLFVAILAMAAAGTAYEPFARRRDRQRFSQIGTSIDVGGRSLNLHCEGAGLPTVVFDTFSHQSGYSWSAVQTETARFTRTCWYDRAGYGWSEADPLGHTADAAVTDLHALLTAAHVPGPYVIVGNGDVSLQVRVYGRRYPAELAGTVLINGNDVEDPPSTPDDHQPLVGRYLGETLPVINKTFCLSVPVLSRVGAFRLVGRARRSGGGYGLTPDQESQAAELSDNPRAYAATAGSLCAQEQSREQAKLTSTLGNRPLMVIASASSQDAESNAYWTGVVQPRLAALSQRGQLVVVTDAQMVPAIVESVREVVRQVREAGAPSN